MPPNDPDHHSAGGRPDNTSASTSRRFPTSTPIQSSSRDLGRRLGHFVESLGGRTLVASLAVAAIVLATAVPAWALIAASTDDPARIQSSPGVTSSGTTRVSDLGVATFIGDIPFVAQIRYASAIAGDVPEGKRFVDGAREASIAAYVQDVALSIALPYLGSAVETKSEIDAWTEATAPPPPALAATAPVYPGSAWPPGGTTRASTVTFYSCLGSGFCGNMAAGPIVHPGAAACSYDLPFGTRFYIANDPAQRVFTCLDRGLLTNTWVDIWFNDPADGWAFQSVVGTRSSIVIVQ